MPSEPSSAGLARRAPVGGAVVVALAAGLDRRPAAAARTPGAAVHGARRARARDRGAHRASAPTATPSSKLLVARLRQRKPRRQPDGPQRLRHPHVPDARDEPLILEHLAERPRAVGAAEPRDESGGIRRVREQVGAEPPHRPEVERQHRPVPLGRLDRIAAEEEPRPPGSGRADRADAPAAVHPQVAPHGDAAFEPEQQVLPDRLDALEPATVDRLRDAGDEPARMRRRGRQAEPDERLESRGRAMERVAFGHPSRVKPARPVLRVGCAVREAADDGDDAVAHALAEAAREADPGALELGLVVEEVRPGRLRVREPHRADQADERDEDRRQADERLALEEADQGEERVAPEVRRRRRSGCGRRTCRCATRPAR